MADDVDDMHEMDDMQEMDIEELDEMDPALGADPGVMPAPRARGVTVVTRATGGTAQPLGVLYVEPAVQVPHAGSRTSLAELGVDAQFVADLLSSCLAHERCGVHLYRSVAARTMQDELRSRYEHFGHETLEHVRLLEELIAATGGDPMYVSGSARATERAAAGLVEATFMLAGSVDPATAELSMLEAVALAESKDHANWQLLSMLATHLPDGPIRDQFASTAAHVLAQEADHYGWARDTRTAMLFTLATGVAPPPTETRDALLEQDEATLLAATAEAEPAASSVRPAAPAGTREDPLARDVNDLLDMSRDELYEAAKELRIEGRSQMNKDELAQAVAEHAKADR